MESLSKQLRDIGSQHNAAFSPDELDALYKAANRLEELSGIYKKFIEFRRKLEDEIRAVRLASNAGVCFQNRLEEILDDYKATS